MSIISNDTHCPGWATEITVVWIHRAGGKSSLVVRLHLATVPRCRTGCGIELCRKHRMQLFWRILVLYADSYTGINVINQPSIGDMMATTALSMHDTTICSDGVTDSPAAHFVTYHTVRRLPDAISTRCSCVDWLALTYRQLWAADAAMPESQPVLNGTVRLPVKTPSWYDSIVDESHRTRKTVSFTKQTPMIHFCDWAQVCCNVRLLSSVRSDSPTIADWSADSCQRWAGNNKSDHCQMAVLVADWLLLANRLHHRLSLCTSVPL